MSVKISRRNLFRLRPADVLQLVRESEKPDTPEPAVVHFRPPGALTNERDFLAVCERCAKCVEACPYGVIESLGPVAGHEQEGTPVLHPERNPCRWCADMPCIHACPSGALTLGPDNAVAPIGKAVLNRETCLTEQGTLCDTCALYCPPHIHALSMINRRPELNAEACVGCGLCAYHCESAPSSLRIAPL